MSIGPRWEGQKSPIVQTADLVDSQLWNWSKRTTRQRRNQVSRSTRVQRPPGQEWMQGALLCAYIATAIACVNVIFIFIAVGIGYSKRSTAHSFSRLRLYHGHCNRTSHWATAIHVIINLFSTALLAASSHAMQCIGAPTREDVDREHKQRRWLDIGVVSWRNFRIMNPKRKILWLLLLLSSTPIHMLYNSVVYASIVTYNYAMILIPDDLSPTESLVPANNSANFYAAVGSTPETLLTEIFNGTFTNMTNEECLDSYDVQYNTQQSTLIFVADRQFLPNESSLRAVMDGYTSIYDYTNNEGTDVAKTAIANNTWTAQGISWNLYSAALGYENPDEPPQIPISHCLAKRAVQRCELLFSPSIALAVIVSNLVKVVWILLRVGDAVASFLHQPDLTTQGRCLMSREDMTHGPDPWELASSGGSILRRRLWPLRLHRTTDIALGNFATSPSEGLLEGGHPRKLSDRKFWFQAASWKRWVLCLVLFSACIGVPSWIYHALVTEAEWSLADQWYLGFGSPNYETGLYFGTSNILALVLLTNSPQLVFSILYFLSKNLLSCMLITAEYNGYATQRKPLRVSWPRGHQRSSYYLSLPMRYSGPLFVMSAALHWLLTESFYSVDWNVYNVFGEVDYDASPNGCGFSPMAIFMTIILLGLALCALLLLGARRFKSPMPLAAHCSAAISAACHPPPGDEAAAFQPVMWGDVSHPESSTHSHCTFTSQAAASPSMSRLYS
ncbi:hypothetical protein ASPACDRAFT_61701 [Aspergillus aculeatus ATCC 16872]|uniref:DUF6536 domain-containing protein n=1 Tax=Aspergillus aculeatus (strain ATCC 16872 / CBS 172.66 / WB 5094) TaxID=690307 RepID=A0A1L9WS80_ASPA1|nr:uncharacterized protein ASPACDRAFT_61701 [Aspergillus aculeatus ATCC 16872]OJJ99036.1 hypothetical protein ASPACDRAFT_61701 [Aspergillus aculeatus ATCC 16872]